jgi:hypothetical protein
VFHQSRHCEQSLSAMPLAQYTNGMLHHGDDPSCLLSTDSMSAVPSEQQICNGYGNGNSAPLGYTSASTSGHMGNSMEATTERRTHMIGLEQERHAPMQHNSPLGSNSQVGPCSASSLSPHAPPLGPWTPAAWAAAAQEDPSLAPTRTNATTATAPPTLESFPPPATESSFTFGTAFDDDDDEDSFHDLDAVMALVASCDSNERRSIGNIGSTRIAAPLPQQSFSNGPSMSTTAAISAERQLDTNSSTGDVSPLPRNFASTTAVSFLAAEEATVLETTTSMYAAQWQQNELDSRLAAQLREEDDLLLTMKLSAYEGNGGNRNHCRRPHEGVDQQATVVAIAEDYPFHRSRLAAAADGDSLSGSATTAHAEWIGQDYSTPTVASTAATAAAAESSHTTATANASRLSNHRFPLSHPSTSTGDTAAAAAIVDDEDEAREATVIDSAPLEKQDEASVAFFTEEAQVLVDDSTIESHNRNTRDHADDDEEHDSDLDRKPAARPTASRSSGRSDATHSGRRRANLHAEVLAIQEQRDIHPAEYTFDRAFQAELVGTDYSYTVAVPSSSQTSSAVADRAAVIPRRRSHDAIHGSAPHSSASPLNTPPEALAFVASSVDDNLATAPISTVASIVRDDDMELESDFLEENGPIEEAQVFVSDDGDSSYLDQKPAASNNPSGRRHHSRSASRNALPMIQEQEADVIPEYEGGNHLPLETEPRLRYMSAHESTESIRAELSSDQDSWEVPTTVARVFSDVGGEPSEASHSPRLVRGPHTAGEAILSAFPSIEHNYTQTTSDSDHVDIVEIQEEADIHPADLSLSDLRETNAEFVGSASSIMGTVNIEGDVTTATVVIDTTLATEANWFTSEAEASTGRETETITAAPVVATTWSTDAGSQPYSEVLSDQGSGTVATVATAFLDPQETNVHSEAAAFVKPPLPQKASPFSDVDDSSAAYSTVDRGVQAASAEPGYIFANATPILQSFEGSARESSNTTVDSESNHTSASQRSGLASANIQMVRTRATKTDTVAITNTLWFNAGSYREL